MHMETEKPSESGQPLLHHLVRSPTGDKRLSDNRGHHHEAVGWEGLQERLLLLHDRQHLLGRSLWSGEADLNAGAPHCTTLKPNHGVASVLVLLVKDEAVSLAETCCPVALDSARNDPAKGLKEITELLFRVVDRQGSNVHVAAVRGPNKRHLRAAGRRRKGRAFLERGRVLGREFFFVWGSPVCGRVPVKMA